MMTTATTKLPAIGTAICWRMISGCDGEGRPVYDDWGFGEVIGHEENPLAEFDGVPILILARRTNYSGGIVLVRPDILV